jgi:microcystin-dependent protein
MPYEGTIGEIMVVPWPSVVPGGWMACEGQQLTIQSNTALFSLLGNQFGGDGRTNFKLPDLRGSTVLGANAAYPMGQAGGIEEVMLTGQQLPAHTHTVFGTTHEANSQSIVNSIFANTAAVPPAVPTAPNLYGPATNLVAIDPDTVASTGGGAPHSNLQPSRALKYLICVTGLYPQRQ